MVRFCISGAAGAGIKVDLCHRDGLDRVAILRIVTTTLCGAIQAFAGSTRLDRTACRAVTSKEREGVLILCKWL